MNPIRKPKLELTWMGKENRPRLEPRILLEDPAKSHHAKHRVTDKDLFDYSLISGDNLLALKALEQESVGKIKEVRHCLVQIRIAVGRQTQYFINNTRAVPLVRKDDAHQGRVFLFPENNALCRMWKLAGNVRFKGLQWTKSW